MCHLHFYSWWCWFIDMVLILFANKRSVTGVLATHMQRVTKVNAHRWLKRYKACHQWTGRTEGHHGKWHYVIRFSLNILAIGRMSLDLVNSKWCLLTEMHCFHYEIWRWTNIDLSFFSWFSLDSLVLMPRTMLT